MDPGNWATDIAGGSHFGYKLIWVLLLSNIIALLLQSLSARLGIVQGRDLAQCSRDLYPPFVNVTLYILAEIAIAACDLAEVLGMAIGLNLLLHIPLLWGVLITILDTFVLLYLQKLGMRKMEAFIISLIAIIGVCLVTELFFSHPDLHAVVGGFSPSLPNHAALYIAVGIIGATVMPHNLYLHSALVQTRKINRDPKSVKTAIRFNILDSTIALNLAFFVNAAILVLAGSVFFTSGNNNVSSIQDAHKFLAPLLGTKWASVLFAVALIASGQSSTITGTLAGQIVMEGYLQLRLNPMARRLLTRLLAIVPAVIVIVISGDSRVDDMLVFSQVLLSMQLAFAVIPLIHFVSDKSKMGEFAIGNITKVVSWVFAGIILFLNIKFFGETVLSWMSGTSSIAIKALILLMVLFLTAILVVTIIYPFVLNKMASGKSIHTNYDLSGIDVNESLAFGTIGLALEFSEKDKKVVEYALRISKEHTKFVLIHIVESASAAALGKEADDFETIEDKRIMAEYVAFFNQRGFDARGELGFKNRVTEIARIVQDNNCELLILGSHGHKTAKDWLLGETINSVRHHVEIPVFIAR